MSDLWTLPDPTGELDPAIYHPLDPTEAEVWWMVARVPDATDGAPQGLRALAAAIDPALTLARMGTLEDFVAEEHLEIRTIFARRRSSCAGWPSTCRWVWPPAGDSWR